MKSPSKGILIAIEGGDAFGTTTQASLLKTNLDYWCSKLKSENTLNLNNKIQLLRNPSNSQSGLRIKSDFENGKIIDGVQASKLFAEDRKQLHEDHTELLLQSNSIVIYDRYLLSSIVHQGLQRIKPEFIYEINNSVPFPNLCFLLMPTASMLQSRLLQRGEICTKEQAESSIEAWKYYFESERGIWESQGCKMICVSAKESADETAKILAAEATASIIHESLKRSAESLR